MRDGVSVSLAADADTEKAVDNPSPYEHTMLGIGATGSASPITASRTRISTRWNHINANGVFYNGYTPDADAVAKAGHQRNSIINVKNGIVTRGILIDIPRLKGVPYLEPGTPIYRRRTWRRGRSRPVSGCRPGDALFVRTGVWAAAQGDGARGCAAGAEGGRSAGLDPSVIPWLRARDVAVMGSDHPQYVSPGPAGLPPGAIHDFALIYLGLPLFDNCDLEALADAAAVRKRWTFLLTGAPLCRFGAAPDRPSTR